MGEIVVGRKDGRNDCVGDSVGLAEGDLLGAHVNSILQGAKEVVPTQLLRPFPLLGVQSELLTHDRPAQDKPVVSSMQFASHSWTVRVGQLAFEVQGVGLGDAKVESQNPHIPGGGVVVVVVVVMPCVVVAVYGRRRRKLMK